MDTDNGDAVVGAACMTADSVVATGLAAVPAKLETVGVTGVKLEPGVFAAKFRKLTLPQGGVPIDVDLDASESEGNVFSDSSEDERIVAGAGVVANSVDDGGIPSYQLTQQHMGDASQTGLDDFGAVGGPSGGSPVEQLQGGPFDGSLGSWVEGGGQLHSSGHGQPPLPRSPEWTQDRQAARQAVQSFNTEFISGMERLAATGVDPDDAEIRVTELAFSDVITKYTALRDRSEAPATETRDAATKAAEAEDKFWKDMVAKGFKRKTHGGAGNPAGGMWQRALAKSPALRASYGKEKGREKQAKFRED